jgi:hypothetical protein
MVLATLLILSSWGAFGADQQPASCELATKSIMSRSESGLAQVGNLGDIQIRCSVAARPVPPKPGENRKMLNPKTVAYQIFANDSKKSVPSETHPTGGGFDGDTQAEWVDFYLHLPLDASELDEEAQRFLAKLEQSMPAGERSGDEHQQAMERVRQMVWQHRAGHFQVDCDIMDGDRVIGVGVVELEVLFKGRFSDVVLPAAK